MSTSSWLGLHGRDPEWDATIYLLTTPLIQDLTAPFISPEERDIEWPQLREAARRWSSGERLLMEAAWDLWSGDGTKPLMAYVGTLDNENLKRLLNGIRIRRGWPVE